MRQCLDLECPLTLKGTNTPWTASSTGAPLPFLGGLLLSTPIYARTEMIIWTRKSIIQIIASWKYFTWFKEFFSISWRIILPWFLFESFFSMVKRITYVRVTALLALLITYWVNIKYYQYFTMLLFMYGPNNVFLWRYNQNNFGWNNYFC